MPIWVKIDSVLCFCIGFIFKLIGHAIVLLTGTAYLGLIMAGIFEYGDGIYDISTLEVISILLFFALLYRHYSYCQRFKANLWSSISRPLYAFGWQALIFGIPLITYAVVQYKLGRTLNIYETSEVKILIWAINLIVLYLSAPCILRQKNRDQTDTQTIHEAAKEEPDLVEEDMNSTDWNNAQEVVK